MEKHVLSLVLLFTLVFCLIPGLVFVETERGNSLPEGVTEIDLRTVLGSGAADVIWACMVNADIGIVFRSIPDDNDDQDVRVNEELIVLNMREISVLSRTQIDEKYDYSIRGWEGGAFVLLGKPIKRTQDQWRYWVSDSERPYLRLNVLPDGTMDEERVEQSSQMVMQGGKTLIQTAIDGSLHAVDLATGEEALLIQGVPRALWAPDAAEEIKTQAAYEAYNRYVPCWDELADWVEGEELGFYNVREFYPNMALDEDRFVYTVVSWEWNAGFGVYDLQTRMDHRFTGDGDFFGLVGDTLFGEALLVDINTYETTALPELVQEQFEAAALWATDAYVEYDISPDSKKLALTGMIARSNELRSWWDRSGTEPKFDYAHTVTITDILTGDLIKAYDIDNPLAMESRVEFYDDTHAMLFCEPKDNGGSAFMYLLNIEE